MRRQTERGKLQKMKIKSQHVMEAATCRASIEITSILQRESTVQKQSDSDTSQKTFSSICFRRLLKRGGMLPVMSERESLNKMWGKSFLCHLMFSETCQNLLIENYYSTEEKKME